MSGAAMPADPQFRRFAFDAVFETSAPDPLDDTTLRARLAMAQAELALLRGDGDAARAAAREQGFDDGLAAAREEHQAALLAVADAIHAAIEEVDANLDAIADDAARDAAGVAYAAAEMLAGRALTETPAAAIDEAIGRALHQVARGQEVHVVVAPTLVAQMEALVGIRQSGDRRRLAITVAGDAGVAPGDARIEWHRGGIVLDAAARAEAVRAAMAPLMAPGNYFPPAETAAPHAVL